MSCEFIPGSSLDAAIWEHFQYLMEFHNDGTCDPHCTDCGRLMVVKAILSAPFKDLQALKMGIPK